jgi:asparagine synthase (glutamine-hydrolysing)
LNKHGFTFEPVKTLKRQKPTKTTLEQAAKELQTLLEESVAKRVAGVEDVAVAFSGGLDSSLIAALAKNAGANVQLMHVSLKEQEETQHAQKVAEELNLPIHVRLYDEQDVENVLPKALRAIEETDPVKVAIGVPFFWAARETAKMGLKVALAGQGADELFGGYKRCADTYLAFGKETAEKSIFNDVATNYKNNLERDPKIFSFHGIELRLPFTSYQLTQYALRIPLELKIEREVDSPRKLVLRKAAENLGLPSSVVYRPKKAVQYTTGVSKALRKLAKESQLNVREYLTQCFRATMVEIGEAGR